MCRFFLSFFVCLIVCFSSGAQDTNFLSSVSPNLKKLLSDHPKALTVLTNALSQAFSNRTVKLLYFYSDNPNQRSAGHFYPNQIGMPDVIICVAEGSYPVDEFIGVLYETLNSEGKNHFQDLVEKARAGTVSRADFAKQVSRLEFDALLSTRELITHLGLSNRETRKSHLYRQFVDMPSDWEKYQSYLRSLYPANHSPIEEYESQYDLLPKPQAH